MSERDATETVPPVAQQQVPTPPMGSPHFTFKIDGGVVLPSWLAALAGIIVLCSVLSLLVTLLVAGPRLAELGREIRLLQIDDQDVQNAVIRANLAHREDFAHLPKKE